ncbi:DUF6270 domain-containing protein [Acinetobacter higginsii]|uniref:DUF6270 domain-containing protein n=1 Tax=Acinetobacter higginsii TaxID=70347 RepID=UPI001F4B44B0|nr:DUF6270 domain-containing protein [Acinetobacter higginsii]MCH7340611.1 DUF6270 domain-containing protein [Acinetobacter higginsii]
MYDFRQERYSKVFEKTYSEILNTDLENGLYHISDEFYFDILVKNFEPAFLENDKIIVCFSGAITDREEKIAPFFSGENIAATLRVPLIAFSDPLVSSSDLNLAWYVGGESNLDYVKKVVSFLNYISEKYKKELVFFGGSGGGFAALLFANLIRKPASCLVWNPQIKIENYLSIAVDKYINVAFKNETKFTDNLERKKFLENKGINNDITNLFENKELKIMYLQNINDKSHINDHLRFFMGNRKWKRVDDNTIFSENIVVHYGNWGEGHSMPQKHIIQNVLEKMILNNGLTNCLENMNEIVERNKHEIHNLILDKTNHKIFPAFAFNENKLHVEIRVFDSVGYIGSDNLSYACYLLYGDEVIDRKMYQKTNSFEFELKEPINNEVIIRCYVVDSNKNAIMNNFIVNSDIYKKKKDFFILGSCVSRDAFLPSYEDISSSGYYPRTSFARLALEPVDVIPELELLSSPFQRKIVKQDMMLNVLNALGNTVYDYILVDLIDERYGLVKYKNTFITYSFEIRNSGVLGDVSKLERIEAGSNEFYSLWEAGFKIFVEYCSKNNLLDKIKINEVYWATALEDNSPIPNYDLERIIYNNLILEKLYGIIRRYLPETSFIKYSKNCFLSKKEHKWGITPFHYIDSLYEHTYAELKALK